MKQIIIPSLLIIVLLLNFGCNDEPTNPQTFSRIVISVKTLKSSTKVQDANVILYDASNGSSINRVSSGPDGICAFDNVNPGTFYLKISAQGFYELPPTNITPIPFSATAGQIINLTYYLTENPGQWAMIKGYVNPRVEGVLIVAKTISGGSHSTYTGPDGYYALFNLSYQTYTLSAYKNGYGSTTDPQVVVSQSNNSATQDISIAAVTGSTLSGSVTFLAANNGIVDISILDSHTLTTINGLTTKIDSNRTYSINGIPNGDYTAWASYKNDGYVMDPDWIYKNPGGLNVNFTTNTNKTLSFSVTDAIELTSPTNSPNLITPVEVDTLKPLFTWEAYPQAKEYIIEVRDLNGHILWGGYSANGTINHAQIPKELTTTRFNFDGSATAQLIRGQIYQWKVYADDNANANVQTLLSSSEDLMGLFIIK